MKKTILLCLLVGGALIGCGDDDDDTLRANDDHERDAAQDVPGDGICDPSLCPEPDTGIACCAPNGACGSDPSSLGFICVANAGEGNVCELDKCPKPSVGNECCTPFGTCGFDPFESNIFCIANPPFVEGPPPDAEVPSCDPSDCPDPQVGLACCLPTGLCGVDTFSIGFCFGPPLDIDGGVLEQPPISVIPPDDPSVDGQCPSYIGLAGEPVWGCCSQFDVCGTFAGTTCFLPAGTPISPNSDEEDGGELDGVLRCDAPTLSSPD